jgi:hypothetical protein
MSIPVPLPGDPRWKKFVTGEVQPEFLGAKVMLGRLSASYRQAPNPATMAACCTELHGLYSKLAHLPTIQAEIATIFK